MSNENFRELPDSNKTFHEADYQVRHLSTEQLEQLRSRVASSPHLQLLRETENGEKQKCP